LIFPRDSQSRRERNSRGLSRGNSHRDSRYAADINILHHRHGVKRVNGIAPLSRVRRVASPAEAEVEAEAEAAAAAAAGGGEDAAEPSASCKPIHVEFPPFASAPHRDN